MEPQDKEFFITIYDQYADAIFRYCYFRIFDRERAKEIMQETFSRTWEYLAGGKKVENMRAFLYKVAHNICVNEVIHPKAYSLDEMAEKNFFDPADEHQRTPEESAEVSMLIDKIRELEPEERSLLTMRYIEDMAVSDIAEMLDMKPNTITVKIKRAEEVLKKNYQNGK